MNKFYQACKYTDVYSFNILSTFIYKRKNEPTVSSQIKKTQQTRLKVKEEAEECVGFYFKKVSGRQTEDKQLSKIGRAKSQSSC